VRERPAGNQIQHRAQLVVVVDVVGWAVPLGLDVLDLGLGPTEQEEVLPNL
jgi:hypothetical protein